MDTNVDPCECLFMPNTEDLPEEWNEMTADERRRFLAYRADDNFAEYLDECSPADRARAIWEQS